LLVPSFFDKLKDAAKTASSGCRKRESAIRETKKAEAGYRSVFARTCASQTHLIGEK